MATLGFQILKIPLFLLLTKYVNESFLFEFTIKPCMATHTRCTNSYSKQHHSWKFTLLLILIVCCRKLIAHRQNVVNDKTVDDDKPTCQQESKQDRTSDVNAQQINDEYVYMGLPEQPKRQAPVTPTTTTPSKRQQSQSLKARRKAPAPPSKSRSFSGQLPSYVRTKVLCLL